MMNFFLIPILLVAVTLLPFWYLTLWWRLSMKVAIAKTAVDTALFGIALILMSAVFLITGTVVLELWITLLTEGSVTVG